MKTHYLTPFALRTILFAALSLSLLMPQQAVAQCSAVTINFESFETGWGIWNDGGSDCSLSNSNPNTGTSSVEIRDNTGVESSTFTNTLNLSAYTSLAVSVSYYTVNMNAGEDFWLQVSTNGGASYTTVKAWVVDIDFVNDTRYNEVINIPGTPNTTMSFRFLCDASGNNDKVYLDDIAIIGYTNPISTFPYSESFELGTGKWSQTPADDFDWTRLSGATPTAGTGPGSASSGSFYVYTESTSPNSPSKTAILNGPCFNFSSLSNPTFDFDYHMYGATMGTLALQASTNGSGWSTVWSLSGDQGNAWVSESVNLAAYAGAGTVSFRFAGTTGSNEASDMAIDKITIFDKPNTAPQANADVASTPNDPISIDVLGNDSDPEGDNITISSITVAPNQGGTAVINNNGTPGNTADDFIDYAPSGSYFGVETFTYQICDDGSPNLCATAVVTVTVSPNNPPVANPDFASTPNEPTLILPLSNDTEPDGHGASSFTITVPPSNGGFASINQNGTPGNVLDDYIEYTPSGTYFGVETFTYEICDDGNPFMCSSAVISVTVYPNTAPVANDDNASTDLLTPIGIDVLANDTDADGHDLTITIFSQPNHGGTAQVGTNGTPDPSDDYIIFGPSGLYTGIETFSYRICDGGNPNLCDIATVSVNIAACVDGTTTVGSPDFPFGSEWKYDDSGNNLGAVWTSTGYNDACWSYGNAEMGFGDGGEATVLNNHNSVTYYFRKHFNVANVNALDNLFMELKRDDGAVVYFNGTEVYRTNMPAGNVGYLTLAASTQSGADETTNHSILIPRSVLVNGDNVVAVEVHQSVLFDTDLSFDMQLSSQAISSDTVLIAAGENWNFNDNGIDLGNQWNTTSIVETANEWDAGPAELGYGDGDEVTVIDYGPDPNNKYPTYYFRKYFAINSFNEFDQLHLKLRKDDGAIIYINGVEVMREGMPAGPVTYNDYANFTAGGADETNYYTINMPASVLNVGSNVISAELHQVNATSSDISFELELHLNPVTVVCDGAQTVEPSPNFNFGSEWRYNDWGFDLGTNWKNNIYVDTCWSKGTGELGFGDGGESTVMNNHGGATYYFRKYFNVNDVTTIDHLVLDMIRDDGAAVYINGTPVWRSNLPNGVLTYSTLAAGTTDGADESNPFTIHVPNSVLINGTNLIAVEVHQDAPGSNDLSFDMKMTEVNFDHTGGILVATGSLWNYNDNGKDLGSSWQVNSPVEASNDWEAGNAELGYGDGDEVTVVGYGPNSSSKYITTYFRHYFTVYDYHPFDSLIINLRRDDGAVVYVNGIEVMRSNMPAGAINYNTTAASVVDLANEDAFFRGGTLASCLQPGANVIAVEIHQISGTSSDISFELELQLTAGDPNIFIAEYDQLSGKVYLDADVSRSLSASDFGQGAIGVWAYQDKDADGEIDYDTDPRLFSDLTNPNGDFNITVYKPHVESVKSDARISADDAVEDGSLGQTSVGAATMKSIRVGLAPKVFFDTLSTWKYYDQGGISDPSWSSLGYDDSGWATGQGILGFGDPVKTTLTSGEIAYYFRKEFTATLSDVNKNAVDLRLMRDDGAVVYLNGVEIYRSNMPAGTITPTTLASTKVEGVDERKYFDVTIEISGFNLGTNVIAVEVHQDGAASSDISFDMALLGSSKIIDDVGYRFQQVNVPQGAKIVDAHIRLVSATTTEKVTNIHIEGQNSDNAAAFTTGIADITSRPRTAENTTWNNIHPFVKEREVQIGGLKNIVQEIVDRPGWSPNNAMAFFLSGHDISFYSFDGGYAPELTISYADTNQTIINYVLGIDDVDMPAYFNYISDGTPSAVLTETGRPVTNLNIGYIGTTSMCVATSDDSFDGFHIINRFSGKNKFIGTTGTGMEIEAIALSENADTLYAVDGNEFGTIDLATGVFTGYGNTIGTASGSAGNINLNDVDGLAFDLSRRIMWATHRRTGGAYDLIFVINTTTGTFVPNAFGAGVDYVVLSGAGTYPDLDDIAVNPNTGNLFAMNNDNGGNTYLIEINVNTGVVSTINNTGLDDMEGQGFHNDGLFYSTSGRVGVPDNSFYQVDTSTAGLVFVGFFESEGDFEGCDCKSGPIVNFLDGTVFNDLNEDGIFDAGELGQPNVDVFIFEDLDGDTVITGADLLVATVQTDADGYFVAGIFRTGNFIAISDTSDLPLGSQLTTPYQMRAPFNRNGSVDFGNDFGFRNGNPLPIELISFTGERKGNVNHLYWSTASEINNDYFLVQRSSDAIQFETIGRVEGAGNSISVLDYEFVDESPQKGINYYRLEQVDYDGTYDHSRIVNLTNPQKNLLNVDIMPNPTSGPISIRIDEQVSADDLTLKIFNMTGTVAEEHTIEAGQSAIDLDLSYLQKGIYLVEIWNDSYQFSQKVILR